MYKRDKKLICNFCKKTYFVAGANVKVSKYCSIKCFGNSIKSKEVRFKCKNCKKVYYRPKCQKGRTNYCSKKCQHASQRIPPVKCFCQWCNKEFYLPKYLVKNRKYCSWECFQGAQGSEEMMGFNHPNFRNGLGIYKSLARKNLLAECKMCNSKSNLIIHHKDKKRFNNKISNLVFLCRSCHGRIHKHIKNITKNKPPS